MRSPKSVSTGYSLKKETSNYFSPQAELWPPSDQLTGQMMGKKNILKSAIRHGASYIDIEVESNDAYKNELKKAAADAGCESIVSYHDYEKTPVMRELEQIISWCFEGGADLAKIACQVNSISDAARLLSLYSLGKPVISIGMGEAGRITRIAAPLLGAPLLMHH